MDEAMRKWVEKLLPIAMTYGSAARGRTWTQDDYAKVFDLAIAAAGPMPTTPQLAETVQRERALVRAAWSHDDAGRADPMAPLSDEECDRIRTEVAQ